MKIAPKHPLEQKRLKSLAELAILDSLPEKDFDAITLIASQICNTPIALISLIDENRQWFKSKIGISESETPRDIAFCAHAILRDEVFLVKDATKDERFFDNPLVTGSPKVRFYAGVPLLSPDGMPIGTVCVKDFEPRTLDQKQLESLRALSSLVTRLLDLKSHLVKAMVLEENLEVKKLAIMSLSEGVTVLDESGKIVDANPAALDILKVNTDQILGMKRKDGLWAAVNEDGTPCPSDSLPSLVALKTGIPQLRKIIGLKTVNSEPRWLQVNAIPLGDNGRKKPSGVTVSFADVTAEINYKKYLMKNSKELKFILDGIPSMIAHWSRDLINLAANEAHTQFFGKSPAELNGKHLKEMMDKAHYEKTLPHIEGVLKGQVQTFEREQLDKDGHTKNTLVSYIPKIEDGVVESFLVIATDITVVKQMESQRQLLQAQLSEASKLATLGEMAGGIAHEINSPLAIIQGKVGILRRLTESGEFDASIFLHDLNVMDDTVDRIAKIIRGMKTYSRDAQGDPFETVPIRDVIEDTLHLCQERLKKDLIDISLTCDSSLQIECRPSQISQIIMNLISNAVDAMADLPKKKISIEVTLVADMVKIKTTDSGSGISEIVANKMMQPFYTTKKIGSGTGLGLSISRGIAESHGGTLTYDANASNTTFVLALPLRQTKESKKSA